jgi:hypothetical protein
MPLTPTSSRLLSLGNIDGVVAAFSSIANNDTWVTGLSSVEHVSITAGASGATVGYTVSGGTVTFKVSTTLSSGATVLVYGYN